MRLHDGIRVHAALPPIAPRGTLLSIRIPPVDRPRLDSLGASGLFGQGAEADGARAFIDEAVHSRANLLITGAGGSGNTTWNL